MKIVLSIAVLALLSAPALAAEKRQGGLVTFCRNVAAAKYEAPATAITILHYDQASGGKYVVKGVVSESGQETRRFQCIYNSDREFEALKKWDD